MANDDDWKQANESSVFMLALNRFMVEHAAPHLIYAGREDVTVRAEMDIYSYEVTIKVTLTEEGKRVDRQLREEENALSKTH